MKRLYHPDMYRFDRAEPSLWEADAPEARLAARPLAGDVRCDVAVIGAGYTGLSAALHLCRDHHADVRVVEAGHVGWGASGRNAGFCGIGGTSLSLAEMEAKYGLEETRRYYRSQVEAIELVRQIIDEEGIDAGLQGDAELEVAPTRAAFRRLTAHARLQRERLGIDTQVVSADEFRGRYFESSELHGAVVQRPAFALDPLRYLHGLAAAAESRGAALHPHSEVIRWTKAGRDHVLSTAGGTLKAQSVILAANGFMPEHLNPALRGRPLPMISAIVVTRPLSDDDLAAHRWQTVNPAITARRILNYYRLLPDRRFLFGGRGHSSGNARQAAGTFQALAHRLGRLWPHWRGVPIEYRWHGLICITRRLTPSLGRLDEDPTVWFAYGFHGNGVNTATWSGRQLAGWLTGSGTRKDGWPQSLPLACRGISPRFPASSLRLRYLQARLALFRIQDAVDRML